MDQSSPTVNTLEQAGPAPKVKPHGFKPREPQDKDSFGYAVWLIIGGEEAKFSVSAKLLGIGRTALSEVVHSTANTNQEVLEKYNWREKMAAHFPDAWKQHEAIFEERAAALPEYDGNRMREPKDKTGFGHVIFIIFG